MRPSQVLLVALSAAILIGPVRAQPRATIVIGAEQAPVGEAPAETW